MKLFKATEHDDEDLKAFFNEQVLKGHFNYRLERPNSFFDQYRISTDDYVTYVLRDNESKIKAMASVLFKKGFINDQEQSVGYVTDLRVAQSRSATLTWMKEIVPALDRERQERQCQFVFSDLEQYESKAYNLLLRRRNRGPLLPRYHLFRKFYMVIVYGKAFFADPALSTVNIDYGRTEDIEAISRYLSEKSVRRPLRFRLTPEKLEERCRRWPNFSMQNFLIARNAQGKIVGCMAPWNNRDVQRIVPTRYHHKSFQVFTTSQTLSWFRLVRPFPTPGSPLKLKHITHGAYDNPDIFYTLLNRAYNDCKNRELLVYQNFIGDYATRPPLSFISVKIPFGLYTVLDNDSKVPDFLHPNPFQPAPDFKITHF